MEPLFYGNSIIICNSNSSLVSHTHFFLSTEMLFSIFLFNADKKSYIELDQLSNNKSGLDEVTYKTSD